MAIPRSTRNSVEARRTGSRPPPHRPPPPKPPKDREAVLCRMFQAHEAAITAAIVVADEASQQRLVTSSLDKSLAYWRLVQNGLDSSKLEAARILCKRPVFSLAGDTDTAKDGSNRVYCARTGGENDILSWEPPKTGFNPRVVLGPHGGWVRDLQSYGRWMFSCDCNTLRQWDLSWTNPRHIRDVSLFKGDIRSIAVGGDKVFVGVTDGTIRSWTIAQNGELVESATCRAHEGRINSIVWDDGVLYSAGNDGNLKSWEGKTLESIAIFNKAHDGRKINCLAVGPEGVVYSGAEGEGVIKRWNGKRLYPCQRPLFCHHASVRVLNFGSINALVSGDANGVVSIWKV